MKRFGAISGLGERLLVTTSATGHRLFDCVVRLRYTVPSDDTDQLSAERSRYGTPRKSLFAVRVEAFRGGGAGSS
jgi:hypothetical protein